MVTRLDATTIEECEYRTRAMLEWMGHDPAEYDTAEAARVGWVQRDGAYLMDWDAIWTSLDRSRR